MTYGGNDLKRDIQVPIADPEDVFICQINFDVLDAPSP
jgi:hypothetical protein